MLLQELQGTLMTCDNQKELAHLQQGPWGINQGQHWVLQRFSGGGLRRIKDVKATGQGFQQGQE